jgi:hypothetical protein
MKMPTLSVGIFHLQFRGQGDPTLLEIVQKIQALPGKKRVGMVIDDPIRPRDNIQASAECCTLDFSRIPQIDTVPASDLEGNETKITYGPQKPCKFTLVLLDPQSNTLYIQYGAGSSGISHTVVGKYLKAVAGLAHLQLEVILHENDALERLRDQRHTAFKVKIAGLVNADALKAQGLGDQAVLDILKVHRAPDAFISLSLGHQPGTLDHILETAAALMGWNSLPNIFGKHKPVEEIYIGETDDDGKENLVDLFADRLKYSEVLDLDRGQDITDAHRHRAVRNAFGKYREELRRRFPARWNV